jgi:hypothetical protein
MTDDVYVVRMSGVVSHQKSHPDPAPAGRLSPAIRDIRSTSLHDGRLFCTHFTLANMNFQSLSIDDQIGILQSVLDDRRAATKASSPIKNGVYVIGLITR